MNILFFPYFDKNPYQDLFYEALRAHGYSARGVVKLCWRYCFSSRYNILHIHWTHPYVCSSNIFKATVKSILFIGKIAAGRITGKKVLWTVHNSYNHSGKHILLDVFVSRFLASLSSKIFVHSESSKKVIAPLFRIDQKKISVMPHGDYVGFYKNDMSNEQARKELDMGEGEPCFLFFGLIRPYKKLELALKAFSIITQKNARFFIVGRAHDKSYVQKLQEMSQGDPRVRIIDRYVGDKEVQVYMKAANCVVLPYLNNLTSGALMLALSFNKIVIVPDTEYYQEILSSSAGVFFNGTYQDLALSMKNVLEMKEETKQYKEDAAAALVRKYSWPKAANVVHSRIAF